MPIEQKKSKIVVKDQSGLVQVLPETSIDAVDGLTSELQTVVHNVGAESIDGVKTFAKNTMTNAIALNDGSTIDVSLGSFFTKTITADTTFTFTGVPAGKTCIFSLILTNAGAFSITFPNSVTWSAGASPTFHVIGKDCLTFFTTDGGTSWLEVSGGGGGGAINDSGVVAGSYGPSTNETPSYGETFTVPQITVNQKGQVTNAVNKSITIPSSDNTDVKVAVVENGWAKAYLLGADAAAYQISGSPVGVTATADSAIYLGSSPGNLHATTFNGALNGNATSATKATNDANDARIDTTYAKLASPALTGTPTAPTAASGTNTTQIATTAFVAGELNAYTPPSNIGLLNAEPTSSNTASLPNGSMIFYEEGESSGSSLNVVTTTGNQFISGVKTFAGGACGGVRALEGSDSVLNMSLAACFTKTITANTTFSFSNVPSGVLCSATVILTNGGAYSVAWPSSVKWPGGTAPTLTSSGVDMLTFTTYDGGTTWFGHPTCIGAA